MLGSGSPRKDHCIEIHVHLLSGPDTQRRVAGSTAVVIDVLRATTTIVQALAAGAAEVVPCVEVDEARRVAASMDVGRVVLGGERKGLPIPGFDLGNSPGDYTAEIVSKRTVIFTTTNGTRALHACRGARRILVAAFSNLSAVARAIANDPVVHLVCAGTRGEIGRDDALVAGALVARMIDLKERAVTLNDEAAIARDAWRGFSLCEPVALAGELAATQGGRDLLAIGLARDIEWAALVDRCDVVPDYETSNGVIRRL